MAGSCTAVLVVSLGSFAYITQNDQTELRIIKTIDTELDSISEGKQPGDEQDEIKGDDDPVRIRSLPL